MHHTFLTVYSTKSWLNFQRAKRSFNELTISLSLTQGRLYSCLSFYVSKTLDMQYAGRVP